MEHRFYSLDADERIALVREAVAAGQPLMIRWAEIEPSFGDRWLPRAAAAAEWLADAATIVDLGCGSMNIERLLRPHQSYIPVDLAQRDERTIVLDLNRSSDLARLPGADACVLLGVLEYCYRPAELVAALHARYPQLVATFNLYDGDGGMDARLAHGWVNHFTREDVVSLFAQHGYRPRRERAFDGRRRECIFDLWRAGV